MTVWSEYDFNSALAIYTQGKLFHPCFSEHSSEREAQSSKSYAWVGLDKAHNGKNFPQRGEQRATLPALLISSDNCVPLFTDQNLRARVMLTDCREYKECYHGLSKLMGIIY